MHACTNSLAIFPEPIRRKSMQKTQQYTAFKWTHTYSSKFVYLLKQDGATVVKGEVDDDEDDFFFRLKKKKFVKNLNI